MTKMNARIMTTHLDRHGEQFLLSALQQIKKQIDNYIIPQGIDHDPRIQPIGRSLTAEVTKLEDGEYALDVLTEYFDDLETIEDIKDKELVIHEYLLDDFEIRSDRNFRDETDKQLISEISNILQCSKPPEEEIKKALEPLSVIWICGAFVLGGISSGFFNKIGSDAFDLLKSKLATLFSKRKEGEKEKLLAFDFTITNKKCNVEIILTNPTPDDIEKVMQEGFNRLDKILPKYFEIPTDKPIRKLVFENENGEELKFKFGVRNDGIPFQVDWTIKKK
jgi:hypothetical protein